jgi:hypothetical protein
MAQHADDNRSQAEKLSEAEHEKAAINNPVLICVDPELHLWRRISPGEAEFDISNEGIDTHEFAEAEKEALQGLEAEGEKEFENGHPGNP